MASASAFMKSGLSSFGQSRLVTIFKIKQLRQKINEYTRYATVFICAIQAWFWVTYICKSRADGGLGLAINLGTLDANGLPDGRYYDWYYQLTSIVTMTVGTVFLMWLGEQID